MFKLDISHQSLMSLYPNPVVTMKYLLELTHKNVSSAVICLCLAQIFLYKKGSKG